MTADTVTQLLADAPAWMPAPNRAGHPADLAHGPGEAFGTSYTAVDSRGIAARHAEADAAEAREVSTVAVLDMGVRMASTCRRLP